MSVATDIPESSDGHDQILDKFLVYGVIVGGTIPVFIFVVLNHILSGQGVPLVAPAFKDKFLLIAVCFTGISTGMWGLRREFPASSPYALNVVAIVSLIGLHLLVYCTGGSLNSVFTFHYLYIPAVVGLVYGGGKIFVTTLFAYWLSCILNVLPRSPALTAFAGSVSGEFWYLFAYCIIFTIQVVMVYVMTVKSSKFRLQ